jgi:hypothetical protein
MTKKHFIALADAIRSANKYAPKGFDFEASHLAVLADFCGPNGGKR